RPVPVPGQRRGPARSRTPPAPRREPPRLTAAGPHRRRPRLPAGQTGRSHPAEREPPARDRVVRPPPGIPPGRPGRAGGWRGPAGVPRRADEGPWVRQCPAGPLLQRRQPTPPRRRAGSPGHTRSGIPQRTVAQGSPRSDGFRPTQALGLGEHLVEENLRLVLGALLAECDLAHEDVPSLGEHPLLTGGESSLPLPTPEVAYHLCHLHRVAGGELLKIGLVAP